MFASGYFTICVIASEIPLERVWYYTGRILPTLRPGGNLTLCDVSFDLEKSTFCTPIVERHSPIAYSLVNEVHWNHPDVWHAGVESALRTLNSTAYIIGGRSLVKAIKDSCTKCRLLWKDQVKVAMGPVDDSCPSILQHPG